MPSRSGDAGLGKLTPGALRTPWPPRLLVGMAPVDRSCWEGTTPLTVDRIAPIIPRPRLTGPESIPRAGGTIS